MEKLEMVVDSYFGMINSMQACSAALSKLDEYACKEFGMSVWWDATHRAPVANVDGTWLARPGARLDATISYLSDLAEKTNQTIIVEFNKVNIEAVPGKSVEQMTQEFQMNMRQMQQRMAAECQ